MKKTKTPQTPQLQEPDTQSKRRLSLPKVAYSAFLCVMMSMIFCQPAYAATDVWTKAKEIMQDVYTPNPCHLHYRRHRHCFGSLAAHELLPFRTDGG